MRLLALSLRRIIFLLCRLQCLFVSVFRPFYFFQIILIRFFRNPALFFILLRAYLRLYRLIDYFFFHPGYLLFKSSALFLRLFRAYLFSYFLSAFVLLSVFSNCRRFPRFYLPLQIPLRRFRFQSRSLFRFLRPLRLFPSPLFLFLSLPYRFFLLFVLFILGIVHPNRLFFRIFNFYIIGVFYLYRICVLLTVTFSLLIRITPRPSPLFFPYPYSRLSPRPRNAPGHIFRPFYLFHIFFAQYFRFPFRRLLFYTFRIRQHLHIVRVNLISAARYSVYIHGFFSAHQLVKLFTAVSDLFSGISVNVRNAELSVFLFCHRHIMIPVYPQYPAFPFL